METHPNWILNFDADLELEHGDGYQSTSSVTARFAELADRVGDLARAGAPSAGYAFCPTPSAQRSLAQRGLVPVTAPSFEVLQRVNHRAFCNGLPDRLPHTDYVFDMRGLTRALEAQSATARWMLRRPFGFAGRGRKRFSGSIPEDVMRWLYASWERGEGVEVVPWVERLADFGWHGHLDRNGKLSLGELTVQDCDEHGAWIRTRRANESDASSVERASMRAMAERVASALLGEGYFGPFGIDGFRWRDEQGLTHLHSCCDVNARYSMGWAVGMGDARPDLT